MLFYLLEKLRDTVFHFMHHLGFGNTLFNTAVGVGFYE